MIDPALLDAVEDAFDAADIDPDITGHTFRDVIINISTEHGTVIEDVYMPCELIRFFKPAWLRQFSRDNRITPPLTACGRHPDLEQE